MKVSRMHLTHCRNWIAAGLLVAASVAWGADAPAASASAPAATLVAVAVTPAAAASAASLDGRIQDVQRFWHAWGTGQFRADLAEKYRVDYVVSTRPVPDRTATFKTPTLYVYRASEL